MDLVVAEEIIIGLLLVASLVAIVVQRFRLPYTVGVVGIGLDARKEDEPNRLSAGDERARQ